MKMNKQKLNPYKINVKMKKKNYKKNVYLMNNI